jgi:hypothetical protein
VAAGADDLHHQALTRSFVPAKAKSLGLSRLCTDLVGLLLVRPKRVAQLVLRLQDRGRSLPGVTGSRIGRSSLGSPGGDCTGSVYGCGSVTGGSVGSAGCG